MANINNVVITGNLTRDPELRALPSGSQVCELGVAVNERVKNSQTQQWEERANFFDVTVWGAQGENCARYLSKGRPVAISGRLRWEQWQAQDGSNRSKVKIVAETVQFLGGRDDAGGGGGQGGGFGQQQGGGGGGGGYGGGQPQQGGGYGQPAPYQGQSDIPVDTGDFAPAPAGGGFGGGAPQPTSDDDIPF